MRKVVSNAPSRRYLLPGSEGRKSLTDMGGVGQINLLMLRNLRLIEQAVLLKPDFSRINEKRDEIGQADKMWSFDVRPALIVF